MPARVTDALDGPGSARLVIGDERLAVINAHRQIKNLVVSERIASSRGKIALEDIESVVSRGGLAGNEAQKETAAFLDGFAQNFLPVLADGDLLLVEPDQTPSLLELADDVTR